MKVTVSPYDAPAAAPAGRDFASESRFVESYVDELLAALSIPGSCTVAVEPDERRRDTLRPVRVTIDGARCVQPVAAGAPAGTLPDQVRHVVCENRELFVSPRFSRDCRRAWAAGGELDFAESPSDFLHRLLVLLVRRGFSIARARGWLRWHDPGEPSTPETAFEEAAAFGEPLPVRLQLHGGEAEAVAREVRDRLAWDWGVDTTVAAVAEPLPTDSAYRLRVNDLLLPPVRGRGLDAAEPLAAAVVRSLVPYLGCLVTTATAGATLSRVAERRPLLEQEAAHRYDRSALAAILRSLADERVPMGDARGILETLATVNLHLPVGKEREYIVLPPETATVRRVSGPSRGGESETSELVQSVRIGLARQIAALHSGGGRLAAILLDPRLEERIASRSLDRHGVRRVEREVRDALPGGRRPVVLLVTAGCRAEVARLLSPGFPDLPVVAYQELTPDTDIDAVARVEDPEPSFAEQSLRDRLDERDGEILAELAPTLPEEGTPEAEGLAGLVGLRIHVGRIAARSQALDDADVLDEEREYLTIELEILDDELGEATEGADDPHEDLTDMLSDLFSPRSGDD